MLKGTKVDEKEGPALPELKGYTSSDYQARAENIVKPFYESLNTPSTKDVVGNVSCAAVAGWLSYSGAKIFKPRDAFISQVQVNFDDFSEKHDTHFSTLPPPTSPLPAPRNFFLFPL